MSKEQPVEWSCKHEPFEGRCVHCDVMFIGGEPVINKEAPKRESVSRKYLEDTIYGHIPIEINPALAAEATKLITAGLLSHFDIRRKS